MSVTVIPFAGNKALHVVVVVAAVDIPLAVKWERSRGAVIYAHGGDYSSFRLVGIRSQ